MERAFDVIVLGATGYTGRLVVEYLAVAPSARSLKWAAAGRSRDRVEEVVRLANAAVPVIAADTRDAASVENLVRQCRVVIACAGPFDIHGPPVLAACVRHRTHYIDITGEFTYVRRAAAEHHEAAQAAGLLIVPCCGFDSVPSDVGNFVLSQAARQRGSALASARSFFAGKGGVSGGTAATMCNIFSTITRADLRRDSLNPPDAPAPQALPTRLGVWRDQQVGRWTAPFIMSGINERVVRRSNALFGSCSTYGEAAMCPSFAAAVAMTLVFYAFAAVLAVPLMRRLLQRYVLPAPGTGPDATAMLKSNFAVEYRGVARNGETLRAAMRYNKSAYVFTALAVSEAAMAIVDADRNCAAPLAACGLAGGVLTPSSALGQQLVDRLVAAGVEISVDGERLLSSAQ